MNRSRTLLIAICYRSLIAMAPCALVCTICGLQKSVRSQRRESSREDSNFDYSNLES